MSHFERWIRSACWLSVALAAACTPGQVGEPTGGGGDGGGGGGGGDSPGTDVEVLRELQLTENARLPEERDANLVDVEVYADRLVFVYDGPPQVALEAGHVVSGVTDGGYLRKLVAVRELSSTRIEAETDPAELGELIGDGHFVVHMSPGDDDFTIRTDGGDVAGNAQMLQGSVNLLSSVSDNVDCGGGTTGTVTLDPAFDMDLDADLEVDLRWNYDWLIPRGELHYARFELTGAVEVGIEVETRSSVSVGCEWAPELEGVEWATTFPVGFVPVVVTHEVKPVFEVMVGGMVETGPSTAAGSATFSLRAGAEYDQARGWQPIWQPDRSGEVSLDVEEEGTLSVSAGMSTGLAYQAKIYDTVGPTVALKPNVTGTFEVMEGACEMSAKVEAGLDLGLKASLDLPVFDRTLVEYSMSESLVKGTVAEKMDALSWCSDPCSEATTCGACNDVPGCGYCEASGECISDSRMAECEASEWRDSLSECEVCSGYASCGACLADAFCGWCASSGQCMTARSGGGPPEACADWVYDTVAACE